MRSLSGSGAKWPTLQGFVLPPTPKPASLREPVSGRLGADWAQRTEGISHAPSTRLTITSQMTQSERRCAFCETEGPLTREHVWPQWLKEVLPQGLQWFGMEVEENGVKTPRIWQGETISATVRRVCRECNNGWMSRIEEYSRPLLTPLVLGERRSLSPQDQEIAATWGFKTILMLQFLNRADQREIPRDQYRWFFQHQTPPSAARISLADFS